MYDNYSAETDRYLNPDGSVTTLAGVIPENPSAEWLARAPKANKVLNPDGSISTIQEVLSNAGIGGGDTPYYVLDEVPEDDFGDEADVAFVLNPETGEPGEPGSGTDDYNALSNKPQINGVTLAGDQTAADLGLESGAVETVTGDLVDGTDPANPVINQSAALKTLSDADGSTYQVFNKADGGGIISAGSSYECGFVVSGAGGANGTYPQIYFDSWSEAGTFDAGTQTWTHNGVKTRLLVRLFADGLKVSSDEANWTAYAADAVTLNDTEQGDLPSLGVETVEAKLQEFYGLCKYFKNNMLTPIDCWPRVVLAFMENGEVMAACNGVTNQNLEPLTDADRAEWVITVDNDAQEPGASGTLRLVFTSDTEWVVESKAWYEDSFGAFLQYSADEPGYEMVGEFDANGGLISISGDLANSSIAKVINPESQYNVDFRKLVDELTVNTLSNQAIRGIKTFLYPPQVPEAFNPSDAVNKAYVDAAIQTAIQAALVT